MLREAGHGGHDIIGFSWNYIFMHWLFIKKKIPAEKNDFWAIFTKQGCKSYSEIVRTSYVSQNNRNQGSLVMILMTAK